MTVRASSIGALLLCLAPVALWSGWFFLVYGAETLFCIPPATGAIPTFWVTVLASAFVVATVTVFARRLQPRGVQSDAASFVSNATIELAGLAVVATVWVVLAAAIIPLCAS